MRVLCLHEASSSAYQFSIDFSKLEERLWTKHGIELVFVDGPLLDVQLQLGDGVGEKDGGITALSANPDGGEGGGIGGGGTSGERVSRRWYVKESSSRRAVALPQSTTTTTQSATTPSSSTPSTTSSIQYSGLDASLLHLSQIWSRGGANISNSTPTLGECLPFQGVLGIGQGADVAALLPLLNYQNVVEEEENNGEDGDDEEEEKENENVTMFQGLQFVVLINGQDIASQRNDENGIVVGDEEKVENDYYVGPHGIQSLHVIMEHNDNDEINDDNDTRRYSSSSSEHLAKQYGPNAQIHHYKPQSSSPTSSSPTSTSSSSSSSPPLTSALSNIIGKFLVSQKNALHSNPAKRKLLKLQTQLANVESLATLAITQEIQKNPPKALMAVIGPAVVMPDAATDGGCASDGSDAGGDNGVVGAAVKGVTEKGESVKVDKAVGAWQGARRRGFGEEGGGAPCPEEFLLREEER